MKGGRRFHFSAMVVSGNRDGVAGFGFGKANDVPGAVEKATRAAHQEPAARSRLSDGTIPHQVHGRYGASKIILIPAVPGTGISAGSCVRAVVELAGVQEHAEQVLRDATTRSIWSRPPSTR